MRTLRTTVLPFAALLGFMLAVVALIHWRDVTGRETPALLISTVFVVICIIIGGCLLGGQR